MYLKNNESFAGLVFVFFFVAQQLVTFLYTPYTYFPIYRFVIIGITILIGLSLPLTKKRYQMPFFFMLTCVFGSLLTYFNDTPIGGGITKAIYAFIGYVGFVYISEKRINLRLFDILMVALYLFFYVSYFSFDEFYRKQVDGDLFGESSSNTIAMGLNVVLMFYLILSVHYDEKNKYQILLFAITNLTLIIIQGSRAGIVVAFVLLVLAISNQLKFKSRRLFGSFLVVSLVASIFIYLKFNQLQEIIDVDHMQGTKSLEEDIRGTAQRSFFINMNPASFLLGYTPDFEFAFNITRTFNAFLDFWNKYGFFPFLFLIACVLRRIIEFKKFYISLVYLIPIFGYSFVESLWGANSWDILIYFSLFYSYNKNESYFQKNHKIL